VAGLAAATCCSNGSVGRCPELLRLRCEDRRRLTSGHGLLEKVEDRLLL